MTATYLFYATLLCDPVYLHARLVVSGVIYVTIGNPAIFVTLYLTGVHFRSELLHDGHVSEQKVKCQPIRTPEIAGL